MLRAAKVPEALETICTEGVKGALLMTIDGILLGSAGEGVEEVLDTGLGAIAASVWDDMASADNGTRENLQVLLLNFEVSNLTARPSCVFCCCTSHVRG